MSNPLTLLWRVNEWEANAYLPNWQNLPGLPVAYSRSLTPPVSIQLIPPPSDPVAVELLVVKNGPAIDLTGSGILVQIPDDFVWGVKWGALADLLSIDALAQDADRAAYCEQRYQECVELAKNYPSVMNVTVDGQTVIPSSVYDMDAYMAGWENAAEGTITQVGFAGRNYVALSPPDDGSTRTDVEMDLVGNMPVPTQDSDYLQVPGDVIDVILDYAQHIASFKMGGSEFKATMSGYRNLLTEAANYNGRLRQMNFFNDALRTPALTELAQTTRIDTPLLVNYKPAGQNG